MNVESHPHHCHCRLNRSHHWASSYSPFSTSFDGSGTRSWFDALSGRVHGLFRSVFFEWGSGWSGTPFPALMSGNGCTSGDHVSVLKSKNNSGNLRFFKQISRLWFSLKYFQSPLSIRLIVAYIFLYIFCSSCSSTFIDFTWEYLAIAAMTWCGMPFCLNQD